MFVIFQKTPPEDWQVSTCWLLLTLQGSAPMAAGPCDRPNLLPAEVHYKGSQTKEAHALHVTLNYITSMCMCRKKSSRGKEALPKGDKESVTIHFQNNTRSLRPGPPGQPSSQVVGEPGTDPTLQL